MSTDLSTRFGRKLQERRAALNLRQADVAAAVGVPQSLISSWESGARSPGLANLFRLADALDASLGDFDVTDRAA